MKITIDLEDRHTIDGGEYVRIVALNDSPPPVDSVKVRETRTRSVEVTRHHKADRALPEARPEIRVPNRDETRKAAEIVKQRNLDYDSRREAEKAEEALKKRGQKMERAVAENLSESGRQHWTNDRNEKLMEMFQAGIPYRKMGAELGISEGSVGVQLSKLRREGKLKAHKRHAGAEA